MARPTLTLKAYKAAMGGFHLIAPGILKGRAAKGKEDPTRLGERLGHSTTPRPKGRLVWLHGVSVGESLSALPVIAGLKARHPDLHFLITSATTTSADILARRVTDETIHQYAPVDTPQAMARFLDHWRPDLAVFIESDIWPNSLMALSERGIPHALISARITQKTFDGWQRLKTSAVQLLSGYALIMPQDEASRVRLAAMGVTLGALANLKTLGDPLPDAPDMRSRLKAEIGTRPVILAASTHPIEEPLIARAAVMNPATREKFNPLLIIVPRHPLRATDITNEIKSMGLNVAQRSRDEPLLPETEVYLADTLGELGVFFRLSDLVIMGGSFSQGIGGHNPLEPARLGKAVITGPDIANWTSIFDGLEARGGVWKAADEAALTTLIQQILTSPDILENTNKKAADFAQDQGQALGRVVQALSAILPEVTHGA